ncbi:MAG: hypothetical protein WBP26_05540 [Candidatus Saccharimonadales bacterium]
MSEQQLLSPLSPPNGQAGRHNGSHPELDALEQQFTTTEGIDSSGGSNSLGNSTPPEVSGIPITTEANTDDVRSAVSTPDNNPTPVITEVESREREHATADLFLRVAMFASDPKRKFAAAPTIRKATGLTYQKVLEAGYSSYDELEKEALKWQAEQEAAASARDRLADISAVADEHAAAWTATANAERAARAVTNDRVKKLSYKAKLEAGGEIALKRNPGLADKIREGVIAQVKNEGLSAGHLEPSHVQVVVDENAVARQSSLAEDLKAHDKAVLLGAKKAEEAISIPIPARSDEDIKMLTDKGFTADEVKLITDDLETDLLRNGMSVSDIQELLAGTITKDEYDARKAEIQDLVDAYGLTPNQVKNLTPDQKHDLDMGDVKPGDLRAFLDKDIDQAEYNNRRAENIQNRRSRIFTGLGAAAAGGAGQSQPAGAGSGNSSGYNTNIPGNGPNTSGSSSGFKANWFDRAGLMFGNVTGKAANWLKNKFSREDPNGKREVRRGRVAIAALGTVAVAGAVWALSKYGFDASTPVGGHASMAPDQAPSPGSVAPLPTSPLNAAEVPVDPDTVGSVGGTVTEQGQATVDSMTQLQPGALEITADHTTIWSSVEDMLSSNGLRHDTVAVDYVKDYIMQSNGLTPEAATNLQAGWGTTVPPEVLAKLNELPVE